MKKQTNICLLEKNSIFADQNIGSGCSAAR